MFKVFGLVVVCLISTALGDTVTCKDGRVVRGRITSETKQSIVVEAPGGAMFVTIRTSDVERIARGEDREETSSATNDGEGSSQLPSALGLFNRAAAALEQNVTVAPVSNATSLQKEDLRQAVGDANSDVVRALIGQRASVIGSVEDVRRGNDGYEIMLSFAADVPRLSAAERSTIDQLEADAKKATQASREATSNSTRNFHRQAAAGTKARIAAIHRASKERIPKHHVRLITRDPAAADLRKGWGVSTEVTITAAQASQQRNGDTLQCCFSATALAERVGKQMQQRSEDDLLEGPGDSKD